MGVGGLLVLGAGAAVLSLMPGNQHIPLFQNSVSASSLVARQDPKLLANIPSRDSESAPTTNQGATPPETSNQTGTPSALTKPTPNSDGCRGDIPSAEQTYNREVKKQKDALDGSLSFKVGLNISSQYVSDYNAKVSQIFNEYLSEAKSDNCDWPVKNPPLLPDTYTH